MKAIEITKPGEIRLIEKDMPKAKQGEALLKVLYCGICGADAPLHGADKAQPNPQHLRQIAGRLAHRAH